ncbi:hypothetical protein PFISCL1PPCAC_6838 [Pristionchus fissidentatus]|uniref:Uncharacterized protein n=1 Tax=Pristionchus fissidentatus TaxID=1538716 RepID=A0AAV5V7B4_9BILA|nr:hypothetical protein PFISCL1PPCAC_6838 [Pristionchus fissidentatus]
MQTSLLLFALLLLLCAALSSADDCLKFSKGSFTIIEDCKNGCEYSYQIKDGATRKLEGGCAKKVPNSSMDCRAEDSRTVCRCKGDRCNQVGYEMSDS